MKAQKFEERKKKRNTEAEGTEKRRRDVRS